MKRTLSLLFGALALGLVTLPAAAGEAVASAWLDLREARLRLVAERPAPGAPELKAGLEILLAEGFKTYWRTAGDSGAPPVFDFTPSTGLGPVAVQYPFPTIFDDGAGGKAWGYKHAVIYPIDAPLTGGNVVLGLKLDFAVCGQLCIPLIAELRLEPAGAARASGLEAGALDRARALVPKLEREPFPRIEIARQQPDAPPSWTLRVPYSGPIAEFAAFAEAGGFLEVTAVEPADPRQVLVRIAGQAPPGAGGRFGPVRLTYGRPGHAFERMIDLDGAPRAP